MTLIDSIENKTLYMSLHLEVNIDNFTLSKWSQETFLLGILSSVVSID